MSYVALKPSLSAVHFRVDVDFERGDLKKILAIQRGELAAYVVKNYAAPEACLRILNNFRSSKDKIPRLGYGADGVEAYFIGASHIERTTSEYLSEALRFEQAVTDLFSGCENPLDRFRKTLALETGTFTSVRAAEYEGKKAGNCKAVYWNNTGDFLLSPHDDLAQLSDPLQKGFEIQRVKRVLALNFYASVSSGAGQLKIWNYEPSVLMRDQLGLTTSGFPYPVELFEGLPELIIPVETGDLCVINGNLVHGVVRGDPQAASENRLLITCFMGIVGGSELIWWT